MTPTGIRFAHLTDLHLPIREQPAFQELLNKRVLGYLSWKRKRSARHDQRVLQILEADIAAQSCQAALITGDIVNIGLPSEYRHARNWLDRHYPGIHVIFVPGNHERYVHAQWHQTLGILSPYMVGVRTKEAILRAPRDFTDFPFVVSPNNMKDIVVVAASSARPTAPFLATGKIGAEQRRRIGDELKAAGDLGKFRILLLHHPVTPDAVSRRKALTDRYQLNEMLARTGVDLVLHGHGHVSHVGAIETFAGSRPVIGGASASHPRARGKLHAARYNLFDLTRSAEGNWILKMSVRELEPETRSVITAQTLTFEYPRIQEIS